MNKTIKIEIAVGIILILTIIIGGIFWLGNDKSQLKNAQTPQIENTQEKNMVGNDRDGHGCIGSAGYSWCEAKQKCLRSWEEPCEPADKIIVTAPAKDSIVTSPVIVSGRARGTWFFEGSFPVEVYDANDKLLGQKYASFVPTPEAPEWMTTEFVNFSGSVEFFKSTTETGYILFKKDNPSDMRELDELYRLPIRFAEINSSDDSLSWRSYDNENLGFSLGFPESWKGYVATESTFAGDKSVSFSFKDGHQPFSLFTIRVITKAGWDTMPKKFGYVKITEDNGKVYLCDGCCGKGATDGGGQFDKFQQDRCKEGGNILETFHLIIND